MRTLACLLIWLLLLPALRAAESVEQSFQAALLAEEARRDLDAAIRGYETVIAQLDAQRALAATAVFRLGECYRKAGRTNDAVAQYQRLLREFPTEATLTRLSRENLLALGITPHASTSSSDEPALAAPPAPADEEQAEIARLRTLFDRSPDLLDAPVEGRTPLFQAASKGQLAVVKALIAWGADVNSNRSTSRETALHAAAGEGHKAVVEALLEARANPNARSAQDRTPLSAAAGRGYAAVVESLLARGAQPKLEKDHAALFAAVEAGRTNLIERLVNVGADVNAVRSFTTSAQSNRACTPLAAAVAAGQRGASQTLIRLGAKVTGDWDLQIVTPHALRDAVIRSQPLDVEWVRELLAAVPKEGFPPGLLNELLRRVVVDQGGREEVIPLLIHAGADVNATVEGGRTVNPLIFLAASKSSARTFELILAAKPDVNATAQDGSTALHAATLRRDIPMTLITRLLQAGADPNRLNIRDYTPLSNVREHLSRLQGGRWQAMPAPARLGGAVPGIPAALPMAVVPQGPTGIEFASNGEDERAQEIAMWSSVESALLAAGARGDLVRRLSLHWQRGQGSGALLRRAGDDPAPTLADFLMIAFSGAVDAVAAWPDLSAIRVHRLNADGTSEREIQVRKDWHTSGDCEWSFPLEWGDAVEIPESDHERNAQFLEHQESVKEALWRCCARRVALTLKGETLDVVLRPPAASTGRAKGLNLRPKNPPAWAPGVAREIPSCRLSEVVHLSGRLRTSSDLTRVQVTRKATGQSWTFDLDKDPRAQNFWLIDGDSIEVPEKEL
ncbi:MAG: ankyrin repeat domain-containing protein [Verrucomicrobiales bacterium]|nr:ankyrin repeat domain-containing protein [Verrucomicrobiales bacterium]